MVLLTSLILALIPLLGVIWIAMRGALTTVDGLFMSLILLAVSGIFGSSALFQLRRKMSGGRATAATAAAAKTAGTTQRGRVERVEFFESNVGQPNKSIVTLSDSGFPPRMLVFDGDMRNALPTGQKVEITLRKAGGHNVLLDVSYS